MAALISEISISEIFLLDYNPSLIPTEIDLGCGAENIAFPSPQASECASGSPPSYLVKMNRFCACAYTVIRRKRPFDKNASGKS